jgi:cell division protein FtsZ
MQGRVEVCVLGMSDMGARGVPVRRPTIPARAKAPLRQEVAAVIEPAPAHHQAMAPTTISASPEPVGATTNLAQNEFGFGEIESRGHFEKTDRNLFDGQDLDVPTYLRKGIKIAI